MRAVRWTPGLLVVAAAAAAFGQESKRERRDVGRGVEGAVCVEAELRRVTVTTEALPVAVLAVTRAGAEQSWREDLPRELLATHRDLESVAVLSGGPGGLVPVWYREEAAVPTGNATAASYQRALAPSLANGTQWAAPFWDCYLSKWVFGYVTPLPERKASAAGLFFSLDLMDLDQCQDLYSPIFGGTHNCDPQSTKCVPLHGFGTRRGGYRCACLPGFLPAPATNLTLNDQYGATLYRCVPSCGEGSQCSAQLDFFLRSFVLTAQLFCIAVTLILAVVVFRKRKCKTIAAGMWTILETILLGILLLYASVIVHFFNPSIERCLFEPWFRELGFIVCYGAIILKLYRILMEFRTRKAHRWVVRDKELLKYLAGMVVITLAYLAAWTATNLNFLRDGFSLTTIGSTDAGQRFVTCKPLWWDYVTETGELLILLFGLHLGLAARNAAVQFQERRFLLATVMLEVAVSMAFYLVKALYWPSLHPDQALLAAFLRSQLTNTLVLLLIFTPKLWYQHKQVRDSRPHLSHEPSDGYKPANTDMDEAPELSLADMNPDDIRAELKRLYTQLEVLKNKTIRQNNPHISKRRGGRKVAHRRFSLQKRGSREKALQRQRAAARPAPTDTMDEKENETSRTPEDSVCSVEGPSVLCDGPSVYAELANLGTPSAPHRTK